MSTSFLADYFEFLRFQSVSTEPKLASQVVECAGWLERKFRAMGLEAKAHSTAGHPIVVARSTPKPGRRTLLIYGHYDVQPADPLEEWRTAPFEPTVKDGIVYARGATDNKGQILAHILGVEQTLRAQGDLPVNIIFLVEGEEESGSEHLAAFLEAHREELRCDVIAI